MNHNSKEELLSDDIKYFKLEIICHIPLFRNPIFIKPPQKTIKKHSEYKNEYLKEKITSIETYNDYFQMKDYLLIKLAHKPPISAIDNMPNTIQKLKDDLKYFKDTIYIHEESTPFFYSPNDTFYPKDEYEDNHFISKYSQSPQIKDVTQRILRARNTRTGKIEYHTLVTMSFKQ